MENQVEGQVGIQVEQDAVRKPYQAPTLACLGTMHTENQTFNNDDGGGGSS